MSSDQNLNPLDFLSLPLSILALLISGYSVYENRKNNRIGHKPTIVSHENNTPTEHSYSIQNKGNGSAYFEKVEYFLNLEPLKNKSLSEAVEEVFAAKGVRYKITITHLGQKGVMAPGEEIVIGKIIVHPEDVRKVQGIDNQAKFDIRITYKSIYGEPTVWASDDRLQTT